MRPREKLTVEEKMSLALDLIKRERTFEEIQAHYRVSHTTAYKVKNLFLDGGRRALMGEFKRRANNNLEARVRALEEQVRGRTKPSSSRRIQQGGSAA